MQADSPKMLPKPDATTVLKLGHDFLDEKVVVSSMMLNQRCVGCWGREEMRYDR